MKVFHEIKKKAQEGRVVDYSIKNITINNWQQVQIQFRPEADVAFISTMLQSMQSALSADAGPKNEHEFEKNSRK